MPAEDYRGPRPADGGRFGVHLQLWERRPAQPVLWNLGVSATEGLRVRCTHPRTQIAHKSHTHDAVHDNAQVSKSIGHILVMTEVSFNTLDKPWYKDIKAVRRCLAHKNTLLPSNPPFSFPFTFPSLLGPINKPNYCLSCCSSPLVTFFPSSSSLFYA